MTVWEGAYNSNDFEKKLMSKSPKESQIAINLAYVSGSTTALLFMPRNYHDNNGDAFRHCFWSALISKHTSPEWAKKWVMAHEQHLPQNNETRIMDEHNNLQGIDLVLKNPGIESSEIIKLCLLLIEEGKLLEIKKDKLVPTTLDGFNLPSIFEAIHETINELLEYLVKNYEKIVTKKDRDKNTALHRAILNDYKDGFKILLDSGLIAVDSPGESGESCLMLCAQYLNKKAYAQALISAGANPNFQAQSSGETALMQAARCNNLEMISLLLPLSNKKITSSNGYTAYDFAMNENNFEIATLLRVK